MTLSYAAHTAIILDFETTGLSPNMGDRAIEIGAVKIEQGQVVDHFQGLMNPGFRVSSFIESYTGITNNMLATAPNCETVMTEFADFIQGYNLIAHNASFDQRFLDAELDRINRRYSGSFCCSMLVARRLYPHATNHKLGTLVHQLALENDGTFHRALADAKMTASLWCHMLDTIEDQYQLSSVPFSVMQKISKTTKASVPSYLQKLKA
ncbi:DNA polymerase III subunit alpha [Photobacterium aquae]|uniref:DNA-directed DNA polymerase n=1 Tax=Photobacterium aquae TaxID=1195763 RepID=A0A0J1JMJ0_9GAMM|nr:3'-5' exonuclease [Photobacterium aquae]KLV03352.1 DNA polymerase III subunit alpha [Photobacterium aquae]